MTETSPLPRSPLLMSRHDTGLLVVDIQDKLVTLTAHPARLIWNAGRLIDAAKLLGDLSVALNDNDKAMTYYKSLMQAPSQDRTNRSRDC